MDLPPQSLARLQSLKKRMEATSYAEVLRAALSLFEFSVEQAEAGGKLFVRTADGKERKLLGPVLP